MRAEPAPPRGTYFFVNLGCPKNLVDAERVAAKLEAFGWREAASRGEAALVVITTCAFISSAMEESVGEILEAGAEKREGQILVVLGCLVSREGKALGPLLPEVDLFLDVHEMLSLPERIEERSTTEDRAAVPSGGAGAPSGGSVGTARGGAVGAAIDRARMKRFTPAHLAYLKIADGCSNHCSYCTIPSIRGDLRSRTREEIRVEAEELAASGVRELMLVAQDTTAWGFERGERECLYDLLETLSDSARFDWVRLMYLHPAHVDVERLVPLIKGGAILPYLDIPVQHVSDRVLTAMGRGYSKADLERLFESLRTRVDDLVLRTTIMVGFPGETEEEFRELVDFIETMSFDHVGVFTFSPERGTKAYALRPRVPQSVALERSDVLLNIQFDISHERLDARVGTELDVLVDSEAGADDRPQPEIRWVGRYFGQAYDVDGVTYLKGDARRSGDFVKARVLEAQPYDLIARIG